MVKISIIFGATEAGAAAAGAASAVWAATDPAPITRLNAAALAAAHNSVFIGSPLPGFCDYEHGFTPQRQWLFGFLKTAYARGTSVTGPSDRISARGMRS